MAGFSDLELDNLADDDDGRDRGCVCRGFLAAAKAERKLEEGKGSSPCSRGATSSFANQPTLAGGGGRVTDSDLGVAEAFVFADKEGMHPAGVVLSVIFALSVSDSPFFFEEDLAAALDFIGNELPSPPPPPLAMNVDSDADASFRSIAVSHTSATPVLPQSLIFLFGFSFA